MEATARGWDSNSDFLGKTYAGSTTAMTPLLLDKTDRFDETHPATPKSILRGATGSAGSPSHSGLGKSVVIDSATPEYSILEPVQVSNDNPLTAPSGTAARDDVESVDSDASLESVVEEWPEWRNSCRKIILKNPWFERFWLVVIVSNCIVLAVEDPTDSTCSTTLCHFTSTAGNIFTFLFTVECVMKVSGLGLHKRRGAYLQDEWNILDFLIVISGLATFVMELVLTDSSSAALTALRAFRLLRPLKAVQAFPAVRVLVQSILASLPQLLDVFVLYFFFVLMMGIVAVQQWKGLLRYRCVKDDPTGTLPVEELLAEDDRVCKEGSWQLGGHRCDWGYQCTSVGINPNQGKLSFDNIGVTGLTLFTGISLEGWTDTMYHTIDATTYFAALYWVLLILFGSFFLLNLTIVIITEAFERKQQDQKTAAFYAIDKDGTGELDREEVRALLSKKYSREITDEELDAAFDAMDEDGGGTISLGEFLAYTQTSSTFLNKRSSVSGLGRDVKQIAKRFPGYDFVNGLYHRTRDTVRHLLAPREKRNTVQEILYQVVTDEEGKHPRLNTLFKRLVLLAIFLNTCTLAVEHYGQPKPMTSILNISNTIFTFVFILEAAAKIYGLGVNVYFSDNFNTFDFIIVLASIVELLGVGQNVSVLRTFRVLRVLKLAKAFPSLQRWITIVVSSVKGAAILTALLGLVVFIVALVGMQLFGGRFCHLDEDWDPDAWYVTPEMRLSGPTCGGKPRSNYDDLGSAILTSFQILTGEDWNMVMYTGMVAVGDWVCIYFVFYYILGNYLMLNLFIAVLLNNRELKDSAIESDDTNDSESEDERRKEEEEQDLLDPLSPAITEAGSPVASPKKVFQQGYAFPGDVPDDEPVQVAPDTRKALEKRRFVPSFLIPYMNNSRALFFLEEGNCLRYAAYRSVESWVFETIVFICILASTTFLALENPRLPEDHPRSQSLESVNFIFIWVFLGEAIIKILGYGFVLHRSSYLRRESWNRLDFFIVVVSLLSLVLPGGEAFSFIKIMRVLRPLRLINKSSGMKVVVQALFTSIKPLFNVLLISLLVWLIFGIMGVQVFSGSFYRCSDETYGDVELAYPNITSKELCLNHCPVERCRWMNYASHFNNLPAAMVTLFEMASLEGWVDVMYLGMDFVEPEKSPQYNNNTFWAIYFLAFIVFGSFFIINMFISVLIDTYYQEKEKAAFAGGQMFLDDRQKKWVNEYKKMISAMKTADDPNELIIRRQLVFVNSPWFDGIITVCIILNVVAMSMEHYGSSPGFDKALESANTVFIAVFTLEAILKLIAMGPTNYFTLVWNRFDFGIVVMSLVGLVLSLLISTSSVVSVFRILRLARLLRMVKKAKGIQRILNTLAMSFVSLVNVAGILFLLLFVYATLGVKLFARVKRGESMGYYANFENFINAILMLLRMSTGEAWQSVNADIRVQPPDCDPQLDECGFPYMATVYFCSYTMAGMYILLNLFIAVILDNFSESAEVDECDTVTVEYIDLMQAAWDAKAIEVNGEPVLTPSTFQDFLREIGPPLGPSSNATTRKVQYFIVSLDVNHDSDGYLHKEEAFLKLFKKMFGESLPPEMEEKLNKEFSKTLEKRGMSSVDGNGEGQQSLSQQMASVRVQALIKSWLARRRVTRLKEELSKPLVNPVSMYTCSIVPEPVREVRVELPNNETWVSSPLLYKPQIEGATGSNSSTGGVVSRGSTKEWDRPALARLLRSYHDNWDRCTAEQKSYYRRNYKKVFQDDSDGVGTGFSHPSVYPDLGSTTEFDV